MKFRLLDVHYKNTDIHYKHTNSTLLYNKLYKKKDSRGI